ncbi:MAG: DEAD/DEAH box helicase [Oligoflexales bacterium]
MDFFDRVLAVKPESVIQRESPQIEIIDESYVSCSLRTEGDLLFGVFHQKFQYVDQHDGYIIATCECLDFLSFDARSLCVHLKKCSEFLSNEKQKREFKYFLKEMNHNENMTIVNWEFFLKLSEDSKNLNNLFIEYRKSSYHCLQSFFCEKQDISLDKEEFYSYLENQTSSNDCFSNTDIQSPFNWNQSLGKDDLSIKNEDFKYKFLNVFSFKSKYGEFFLDGRNNYERFSLDVEFNLSGLNPGDFQIQIFFIKDSLKIPMQQTSCSPDLGLFFYNHQVYSYLSYNKLKDFLFFLEEEDFLINSDMANTLNHKIAPVFNTPGVLMQVKTHGKLIFSNTLDADDANVCDLSVVVDLNTRLFTSSGLRMDVFFCYENIKIRSSDRRCHSLFDFVSRTRVIRNLKKEEYFLSFLNHLGFKKLSSGRWSDPDSVIEAVMDQILTSGCRVVVNTFEVQSNPVVYGEIKETHDGFEWRGFVDFQGNKCSLLKIKSVMERGCRQIFLQDMRLGFLSRDWVRHFSLLFLSGVCRDDVMFFEKSHVFILREYLCHSRVTVPESLRLKDVSFQDGVFFKKHKTPLKFYKNLRDYQKMGVYWLFFLNQKGVGGCLSDEMGLGKTAQVLSFLDQKKFFSQKPYLIVVPKTLVFNWIREIEKFTKLSFFSYYGDNRRLDSFSDQNIILTTHHTVKHDIEKLNRFNFSVVCLDEAQVIKNEKSYIAQVMKMLKSDMNIAMTGTPIENNAKDLESIADFINPGLVSDSVKLQEKLKANDLYHIIRPFFLRREKKDVLQSLPKLNSQILMCEMSVIQKTRYDDAKSYFLKKIRKEKNALNPVKSKKFILEALLRLRQIACHPGLIFPFAEGDSGKVQVLLDKIDVLCREKKKIVIFSQFTSFLKIISYELDKRHLLYESLNGSTKDREKCIDSFQGSEDCLIFLVSLKAGGVGLNLTASHYCFLLDPWWNPAVENQAIARLHRSGQSHPVFVYRIISQGTIEEKILDIQKLKEKEFCDFFTDEISIGDICDFLLV